MISKPHIYTEQEAYIKLSALCASAEYCEADMRRKMSKWILVENEEAEKARIIDGDDIDESQSSNEAIAERIIRKLYAEKFLDTARYAHAFVRDKFRYNHWGRVRISQELRIRKIDSNTIEDALTEIPEEDNLDTLRNLINNKRKSVKGKSNYEIRCKLIRFALGRGFQMDDIIKVIGD